MMFEEIAAWTGKGIEVVGMVVMTVGIAIALVRYGLKFREANSFHNVRRGVGHAILLGLELLVAADIIHTIATELTFESVGTLAAIVGIRTFLGFALTLELEGRWPWQRRAPSETH